VWHDALFIAQYSHLALKKSIDFFSVIYRAHHHVLLVLPKHSWIYLHNMFLLRPA